MIDVSFIFKKQQIMKKNMQKMWFKELQGLVIQKKI